MYSCERSMMCLSAILLARTRCFSEFPLLWTVLTFNGNLALKIIQGESMSRFTPTAFEAVPGYQKNINTLGLL